MHFQLILDAVQNMAPTRNYEKRAEDCFIMLQTGIVADTKKIKEA